MITHSRYQPTARHQRATPLITVFVRFDTITTFALLCIAFVALRVVLQIEDLTDDNYVKHIRFTRESNTEAKAYDEVSCKRKTRSNPTF
jgi:hypothetical protein